MHSYAKAPIKSLPNAICYYTGNEQTADKVMHLSWKSLSLASLDKSKNLAK